MPDQAPATVDGWLGRCYAADMLNHGTLTEAMTGLVAWLEADPENKVAAQTKVSGFTDPITKRDFISRKYRTYLVAALAA